LSSVACTLVDNIVDKLAKHNACSSFGGYNLRSAKQKSRPFSITPLGHVNRTASNLFSFSRRFAHWKHAESKDFSEALRIPHPMQAFHKL
jgi:hypothetical protein